MGSEDDYPDLGVYYPRRERNDFLHYHSGGYAESEEGVFVDTEGELYGKIYDFKPHIETPKIAADVRNKPEGFKQFAELYAKSCCRVIASYILAEQQKQDCEVCGEKATYFSRSCKFVCKDHAKLSTPKDFLLRTLDEHFENRLTKEYTGTAFRVSTRKLLTAMHVVKPSHEVCHYLVTDYKRTYNLVSIRVITHHHTPSKPGYDEALEENEYYVKKLPQVEGLKVVFPAKWEYQTYEWKTPFDFAFLEFTDAAPTLEKLPIATPALLSATNSFSHAAVFGYFASLALQKFLEDYCMDEKKQKRFVEIFFSVSSYFDKLVMSEAEYVFKEHGPFVPHKCPTIRGTSGGLFVCYVPGTYPKKIYFNGLHVGGNEHMHNNIMTPVADALGLAYIAEILQTFDQGIVEHADLVQIGNLIQHHSEHLQQLGIIINQQLQQEISARLDQSSTVSATTIK